MFPTSDAALPPITPGTGLFWRTVSAPLRLMVAILTPLLVTDVSYGHGGYDEEIKRSDELIAAEPDNAAHWFHRGHLHCLHGDWKAALPDLDKAESLAPGRYPVDLVRGQAWMAGGELEAARIALDGFVRSSPEVAEGFAARARLMLKIGDGEAAVADFRQALAKSRTPEPDLYIETAEALLAQERPAEAVKELQAGMARLGELPALADRALTLEVSLGLYDEALSRVAALQAAAPRREPWMAKRASILAQAGRLADSRAAWMQLRDHLLALPNLERGSHSMSLLLEQAQQAIKSLEHITTPSPQCP